jgi:hypothetical protein
VAWLCSSLRRCWPRLALNTHASILETGPLVQAGGACHNGCEHDLGCACHQLVAKYLHPPISCFGFYLRRQHPCC